MSVAPAEQTKSNELKSTEKHEKVPQAPGSWIARKLKSMWYLFYGVSLLSLKFKIVREILARNLRYDPSKDTRKWTSQNGFKFFLAISFMKKKHSFYRDSR